MRGTKLLYLANEFPIKKRLFLELPDTIVKCYSDKVSGKKKSYSLQNDFGGKAWETKYEQFTSICSTRKNFLVQHALITVQTHT